MWDRGCAVRFRWRELLTTAVPWELGDGRRRGRGREVEHEARLRPTQQVCAVVSTLAAPLCPSAYVGASGFRTALRQLSCLLAKRWVITKLGRGPYVSLNVRPERLRADYPPLRTSP